METEIGILIPILFLVLTIYIQKRNEKIEILEKEKEYLQKEINDLKEKKNHSSSENTSEKKEKEQDPHSQTSQNNPWHNPELYQNDLNELGIFEKDINQISKQDLKKAYKKVAKQWHPDFAQEANEIELRKKQFQKINESYEKLLKLF